MQPPKFARRSPRWVWNGPVAGLVKVAVVRVVALEKLSPLNCSDNWKSVLPWTRLGRAPLNGKSQKAEGRSNARKRRFQTLIVCPIWQGTLSCLISGPIRPAKNVSNMCLPPKRCTWVTLLAVLDSRSLQNVWHLKIKTRQQPQPKLPARRNATQQWHSKFFRIETEKMADTIAILPTSRLPNNQKQLQRNICWDQIPRKHD
mmetsp:Transcript_19534/g.42106  ORF Transcript_19534/g.42106 Transcript_19534/m.42106 type:complete len:202 (-) Transcript_19534:258-863(-)